MWRVIISVVTAVGAAIVARTYSEKPERVVVAPGAPPREAGIAAPPNTTVREAAVEAAPVPQPGWSLPKPEVIPRATYWPVLLAGGVAFVFWGLISDIWIFGTGLILTIMSMIGWVNDLLNE